jgi:hypothetical protein
MITATRNEQIERILAVRPVSYAAIRPRIRNGDIALARPSSVEGLLISEVTKADYSHATMVGWLGGGKIQNPRSGTMPSMVVQNLQSGVLLIGETRQRVGARLISLSAEIARWSGCYDLFRVRRDVCPRFHNRLAWRFMARAGGAEYSWRDILRIWLRRRFGTRMPVTANTDDPMQPRFCSALVHAALRAGGGPQVSVYDADVAPGDLSNPNLFDYIATLFWSEEQADEFRRKQADICGQQAG